jgi:predicted amidophosphoribosyltransferase
VGSEPVVACKGCGHPLSADATFCAQCGRPVETSDEAEPEQGAEERAVDETIMHSSDPWER